MMRPSNYYTKGLQTLGERWGSKSSIAIRWSNLLTLLNAQTAFIKRDRGTDQGQTTITVSSSLCRLR